MGLGLRAKSKGLGLRGLATHARPKRNLGIKRVPFLVGLRELKPEKAGIRAYSRS